MAELIPAPFSDLVARIHREAATQAAVFELPRRNWFVPNDKTPNFNVRFHDRPAGNPLGPAAGPHTQMAQNLVLAYLGGGRIMELKTVQLNDRLTIPRPCIDMTNVGYNVEWSQELLVEQSLQEYVAGMMLIEMLRHGAAEPACPGYGSLMLGPHGSYLFDISVGYDLAGIMSEKIQCFLDGLRDASAVIARLRDEIPTQYAAARDLDYPARISSSVTLSTFHGCPAHEIESICEFLIAERDLDVVVKMNPPMLGKERLEHLLNDVMGYKEITVNPAAYTSGLQFEESLGLCSRLTTFAAQRGRKVGFKFSNTLEVRNHRDFFTPDNEVMYLSGPPLHVITMTLAEEFRKSVGPEVLMTFSAGVDHANVANTVAAGFRPITVSSDLLKPGGYGRFAIYLKNLGDAMTKAGAADIDSFILQAFGNDAPGRSLSEVAAKNLASAAELARNDARYRADAVKKTPKRVDSHLVVFDCLTCNKCIPVCPNAANFTYPVPVTGFTYSDCVIEPDGSSARGEQRTFKLVKDWQIANFGDFCNECGNCDTFCPEYGGPYIEKPTFYSGAAAWHEAAPRDGFYVEAGSKGHGGSVTLLGRYKGQEYRLTRGANELIFRDGRAVARFDFEHQLKSATTADGGSFSSSHTLNMEVYYNFYYLLTGVLDARHVNPINAALSAATAGAIPGAA